MEKSARFEFPILGAPSVIAAKAALAADIQGKYSEMHTALMAAETRHDEASIMGVATRLGLDTKIKSGYGDQTSFRAIGDGSSSCRGFWVFRARRRSLWGSKTLASQN